MLRLTKNARFEEVNLHAGEIDLESRELQLEKGYTIHILKYNFTVSI